MFEIVEYSLSTIIRGVCNSGNLAVGPEEIVCEQEFEFLCSFTPRKPVVIFCVEICLIHGIGHSTITDVLLTSSINLPFWLEYDSLPTIQSKRQLYLTSSYLCFSKYNLIFVHCTQNSTCG